MRRAVERTIGRTRLRRGEAKNGEQQMASASAPFVLHTTSIILFSNQLRLADLHLEPSRLHEARLAIATRVRDFAAELMAWLRPGVVAGHRAVMCSCRWWRVSVQEAFAPLSADR